MAYDWLAVQHLSQFLDLESLRFAWSKGNDNACIVFFQAERNPYAAADFYVAVHLLRYCVSE